ncbi:WG repeat-containing protein [Reichenbachiella ulvae]|uniref:WG repeat-containing protein n=1 Tax=Reichenbachiella ulvae TaxID=2980104 RepID=A0ABT3CWS4_9BACT|nr:WG repeat-containing protein [Reichenbachiella ulvae]MCV9388082.1 WG repeat-containing protein [Reichenbachiella ulvae]
MRGFQLKAKIFLLALCFLSSLSLWAFSPTPYVFYTENGKTGLKDESGQVLIAAQYEKLGWSKGLEHPVNEVIGYFDGERWGLISLKDRRVTAPKFYTLEAVHSGLIIASIKGRFSNLLLYGTINSKGQTVIPFENHSLKVQSDLLIASKIESGRTRYGLYSENSKVLLPKQYTQIEHFDESLFVFRDTMNLYGVIDKAGEVKVAASLDSVGSLENDLAKIYRAGKVGLINQYGELKLEPNFKEVSGPFETESFSSFEIKTASDSLLGQWSADSIFLIRGQFLAVCANGWVEVFDENRESIYVGLIPDQVDAFKNHLIISDHRKSTIIPAKGVKFGPNVFEEIRVDEHVLFAKSKSGWSIYNAFGRKLTNKQFESVQVESNNLIPVKRNGYWGYLDLRGQVAIPFKYDQVSPFQQQLAKVKNMDFEHLINQFGEVVGQASYDSIALNDNNTAVVKSRTRTDIVNEDGLALFQTYNQLVPHELGYLERTTDGKMGLLSEGGEILFYPNCDTISGLIDGQYLILKKKDQWAVSSKSGQLLLPFSDRFEEVSLISEGLIAIKENGQYGFVDLNGQLRIANRYDSVGGFSEGLSAVKLNGHWGYVNLGEELVIQPNLDFVTPMKAGMVIVKRAGLYGALDAAGDEKVMIEYDAIKRTENGLFIVRKQFKYGLFDQAGKMILNPSYDKIESTVDGNFIVRRRGKSGLMNDRGLYVIPLRYDLIQELQEGQYTCRRSGD